ncbi:MAG: hypothetical protein WKG03_05975 [Telluria sp.]
MNLQTFMRGTFNLAGKHGTVHANAHGNASQRRRQIRAWKRAGYTVWQWRSYSGCAAAPILQR